MKRSLGMAMIPGKHLVSCEAETKDWTVDRVGNEGKAGEPADAGGDAGSNAAVGGSADAGAPLDTPPDVAECANNADF